MDRVQREDRRRLPENEAIWLYEVDVDDLFRRNHRLLTDSSLGVLPPERVGASRRPRRLHGDLH